MSKRRLDITGDRYGRLTVIKEVEPNKYHRRWLCKCDCGNETIAYMNSLRGGRTQSCGCLQKERTSEKNLTDLTGKRFGRLTVLQRSETKSKSRKVIWKCVCDCGRKTNVLSDRLLNGTTKSCGCLKVDKGKSVQSYNQENLFKDGVFTPLLKSKLRSDNTTGVKGVYAVKRKNSIKYQAKIGLKNKEIFLGTYDTIEEAEKARKLGEKRYHEPYTKG